MNDIKNAGLTQQTNLQAGLEVVGIDLNTTLKEIVDILGKAGTNALTFPAMLAQEPVDFQEVVDESTQTLGQAWMNAVTFPAMFIK